MSKPIHNNISVSDATLKPAFSSTNEAKPQTTISRLEKAIKPFYFFTIATILKTMTDQNHPMGNGKIASLWELYSFKNYSLENQINTLNIDEKYNPALPKDNLTKEVLNSIFTKKQKNIKNKSNQKVGEVLDNYFYLKSLACQNDDVNVSCDADDYQQTLASYYIKTLHFILGGEIMKVSPSDNHYKSGKKDTQNSANHNHNRYYFNPILTSSDIDILSSGIYSNRYLTIEEKRHLVRLLMRMQPATTLFSNRNITSRLLHNSPDTLITTRTDTLKGLSRAQTIDLLQEYFEEFIYQLPTHNPPTPYTSYRNQASITTSSYKHHLSSNFILPLQHQLLNTINTITLAIQNEHQIKVIYGIIKVQNNDIGLGVKTYKTELIENHKEQILNPYAIIYHNGHYYLIATGNHCQDKILHYRLDRMVEVEPYIVYRKEKPNKRAAIPDSLKEYYKSTEHNSSSLSREEYELDNQDLEFDSRNQSKLKFFDEIAYQNDHPLMTYTQPHDNKTDIILVSNQRGLSKIVDAFGYDNTKIIIQFKHDSKEYLVTLKSIYPIIAKRLCIQYFQDLYVLQNGTKEQMKLAAAIKSELKKALSNYS